MTVSLRTRLFLTVAIVLAGAIAASSLLSRQATLVEVREVVEHGAVVRQDVEGIRSAVERGLGDGFDLNGALARTSAVEKRDLVVIDRDRRIAGASRPGLLTARVTRATAEGDLTLELGPGRGGPETALALVGAHPVAIADPTGREIGMLFALPRGEDARPLAGARHLPPPWVLMTLAVATIALVLTFMLSRRILRPVGELKAAAERMEGGDLDVQVRVSGRDEIGELGRAFNGMAARLARNERLRRQMVSDVAHELRSPVTNLRCTLEAIQDGLTPPDRASIDALLEETLFLQRLIADLQELALAEAGGLALNWGTLRIDDVVRRAVQAVSSSGAARITTAVEKDLPAVAGDADRIEQVLRNVLSNAVRHTPPDGRITVRAERDGDRVRLAVEDTGSGIPSDHLPHVFDRFYRVDQSRARSTGGAGLGLAIARQLVAAHHGAIRAASGGEGQGATFTIELPIHQISGFPHDLGERRAHD